MDDQHKIDVLREALRRCMRLSHYHNEDDCYYSCPMHPHYGGNLLPEDRYCDCGTERNDNFIRQILKDTV